MRQPDRFEDHRPMLLAGLRRTYRFSEAPLAIPAAWETFGAGLPLPGQVGATTYGAGCDADMAAGTFEYMCAVEVETFDALDPDVGRMKVPAARYAVFVHRGPIMDIVATIDAAHGWLDANGEWKDGETPTFERYGPAFDPATGADTEIWLPVIPAS
jgi:AraC family transcriptional regulator